MSKVLIGNSYFYRLDPKQWNFKQPYPPLATILAASVLRRKGFDVALFDTNLRSSPEEIKHLLNDQPSYYVLYDDGFNYLSKMCLTNMRTAAFQMIRLAKDSGCTVIVSSSDASDHYSKYLDQGADFIIRGEAEETLGELLSCLENGRPYADVAGIVYSSPEGAKTNSQRVVMRDLDGLPMPAWDLVDVDAYRRIWKKHHGYFSLNMATTRGCPYKCNWCAKPIYGNRYNSRSPENVATEIEHLLKTYSPDHFWMCDDIFGLRPGWIEEFNFIVQKKQLKFKYKIQSRVDLLLQEHTVEALAESGAETIWVGAESGSQKILDAMDKGITVEEIRTATQLLKKHGVKVAYFIQFGYLGETKSDVEQTIRMILELMPDEVGISVSYPLPGTKFYEKVKDELREKQNWADSDDLAMMFQSTYNSKYYKTLHRYVHSVYRKRKGINTLKKVSQTPTSFSFKDVKSLLGIVYFGVQAFVLNRELDRSQETLIYSN
jgi:anaerobic magnesium-protoporphyrin IX monomethyl ester cyclase